MNANEKDSTLSENSEVGADLRAALPSSDPNPLLTLSQDQKEELFIWMREGSDTDALKLRLAEAGLPPATRRQLDQFFTIYTEERWTKRIERAAQEATTVTRLVRENPRQIPDAILAALGQETFRQISSGRVEIGVLARYTALFLRAREQDRAERALDAQIEKNRAERRTKIERALDAFAEEIAHHPQALAAFQILKATLLDEDQPTPEPA